MKYISENVIREAYILMDYTSLELELYGIKLAESIIGEQEFKRSLADPELPEMRFLANLTIPGVETIALLAVQTYHLTHALLLANSQNHVSGLTGCPADNSLPDAVRLNYHMLIDHCIAFLFRQHETLYNLIKEDEYFPGRLDKSLMADQKGYIIFNTLDNVGIEYTLIIAYINALFKTINELTTLVTAKNFCAN